MDTFIFPIPLLSTVWFCRITVQTLCEETLEGFQYITYFDSTFNELLLQCMQRNRICTEKHFI